MGLEGKLLLLLLQEMLEYRSPVRGRGPLYDINMKQIGLYIVNRKNVDI